MKKGQVEMRWNVWKSGAASNCHANPEGKRLGDSVGMSSTLINYTQVSFSYWIDEGGFIY